MRKLAAIRDTPDGRTYTLSLVPWVFRRWTKRREAKAVFGFVPHYELAILRGSDVTSPHCVVYFADKITAEEMYDQIAQAIIQDGLYGKPLGNLLRNSDPKKVDGRWGTGLQPMRGSERFDKQEITESDAAVFNGRLQQYKAR